MSQIPVTSFSTFIAGKDHDEEDEEKEEYKKLKEQDDPNLVTERKSNWMIIKLIAKVIKTIDLTVSPISFRTYIAVYFESNCKIQRNFWGSIL